MAEYAERYGLLAAFDSADGLAAAVRRVREAGYRRVDAYTPIPSPEVTDALAARDGRIPATALACGLAAAATAYFMQWYSSVLSYPFVVGGKPLHAWPAFLVITFVLCVLIAVIGTAAAMLVLNGLPRPYHSIFNARLYERSGSDRFLLCIRADDPRFDPDETHALLSELQPEAIEEVAA